MIGATLSRYFAKAFARAFGYVFLGIFVLVYLIDFIELLRRSGDVSGASTATVGLLTLFRVPTVTEQVLPFAVLFGSMIAFIGLTRRLELVVARSAGLSVWQFLMPPVAVALLLGALTTAAYSPLSAVLKQRAVGMEARLFRNAGKPGTDGLWLRQTSVDGGAILRADGVAADRVTLQNVTAFVFAKDGAFLERVTAPSATLLPGTWRFEDARVVAPDADGEPRDDHTYLLATNLTPEQLTKAVLLPEEVPFWSLPGVAAQTEQAGLDPTPFRLRFQVLLARPLLFVAMVLIAAIFSLRFFRFGGVARMAAGGIAAGFALYVVSKLTSDLGGAGILNAGVAAWSPAVATTMLATLVLLHQEDG